MITIDIVPTEPLISRSWDRLDTWRLFERIVDYCEARTRDDPSESFATWAKEHGLVEVDVLVGDGHG